MLINISKKRFWPRNEYITYDFTKKQRGDYLNVWFPGSHVTVQKNITYLIDEYWTIKKVDADSAAHLHEKVFNPISLKITTSGLKDDNNDPLYNMGFQIHSIDDSTYSIWWINKPLANLVSIRLMVMGLVDSFDVLNGNKILDACIELGADKDSIDYD